MDSEKPKGEPLTILLVEDDPDHAELVIRCFEDHRIANKVLHVRDGEMALDYLFRRGDYADPAKSPRPHLVLLDLRLPGIDGLEVLKQVKSVEGIKEIPLVILTTSNASLDKVSAYRNYANSYLVKPLDFQKFERLTEELGFYWLGWNQHPWS